MTAEVLIAMDSERAVLENNPLLENLQPTHGLVWYFFFVLLIQKRSHFAENFWPCTTGTLPDSFSLLKLFPHIAHARYRISLLRLPGARIRLLLLTIRFVGTSLAVSTALLCLCLARGAGACVCSVRILCTFAQKLALLQDQ